jgi:replicative DNA helicase
MSRPSKDAKTVRPVLSDLKDSGGIEASADVVMLLYRPEYYGFKTTGTMKVSTEGLAEIIIAKNRPGQMGSVPARYTGKFTKFSNHESYGQEVQIEENQIEPF